MLSYIISSPLPTTFSLEKHKAVLIFLLKLSIEMQENLHKKRKCAGKREYIHDGKILNKGKSYAMTKGGMLRVFLLREMQKKISHQLDELPLRMRRHVPSEQGGKRRNGA
ncbi:hypothetical protein [Selenomonas sputigena]|nr:hypothetical protein [Selenomonas sputigena]UZE46642.1 hypothetical protein OL236_01530 [Selenomonas sputigena]